MSDYKCTYAIPNWDEHFETSKSRKLKNILFLSMRLMIDNDLYAELTTHPNGAAHLGCWFAILMAAAKSHKRGTLLRANGQPHTAETLALLTRLPVEVLNEALSRFVEMGLLEASAENLPLSPGISRSLPLTSPVRSGQVTSGQVRDGHDTEGQDREGQDTEGQVTQASENLPLSPTENLKALEREWQECSDPIERKKVRERYQAAARAAA